jgi:hypothetical protein
MTCIVLDGICRSAHHVRDGGTVAQERENNRRVLDRVCYLGDRRHPLEAAAPAPTTDTLDLFMLRSSAEIVGGVQRRRPDTGNRMVVGWLRRKAIMPG